LDNHFYIGLDIGGTKCSAILGDEQGRIISKHVFDSGKHIKPDVILEQFTRKINLLIQVNNIETVDIKAIGISCGGPLDSKRGIIMQPPNLPLWDNINVKEYFWETFNIPVYLQNDANACALAEWRFGAGKGTNNMLFLTFGTGMGMGLILNGELYTGANDMAGEVGHIRLSEDGPLGYGKRGSFEGFCSGGGIKDLAQRTIKKKFEKNETVDFYSDEKILNEITAKDICFAAEKGDLTALEIIEKSAEYLGRGLAILIDILNPERIVIGSIFERAEKLFRTKMEEVIKKEALGISAAACKIASAVLGDNIGDIAAISIAINGGENE